MFTYFVDIALNYMVCELCLNKALIKKYLKSYRNAKELTRTLRNPNVDSFHFQSIISCVKRWS